MKIKDKSQGNKKVTESEILENKDALGLASIYWAAMISLLVVACLAGGVMLSENFNDVMESSTANLQVSIPDSGTLIIEHRGGDPIEFTENVGVYLYLNGNEYDLFCNSNKAFLEVGESREFTLPENVKLEKGNAAILKVFNKKEKKEIYRKEIYVH